MKDPLPDRDGSRVTKSTERMSRVMSTPLPDNWRSTNLPLNTNQVLKILGGRTPQHLSRMVRTGVFPAPFKTSLRRNCWWSQDLIAYFKHLEHLALAHKRATPHEAAEKLKLALQRAKELSDE